MPCDLSAHIRGRHGLVEYIGSKSDGQNRAGIEGHSEELWVKIVTVGLRFTALRLVAVTAVVAGIVAGAIGIPVTTIVLGRLPAVLEVLGSVAKHLAKEALKRFRLIVFVLMVAVLAVVVVGLAMAVVLVTTAVATTTTVVVLGYGRFVRGIESTAQVLLCSLRSRVS